MKAKQIKDLSTAIGNDANVQANITARHTHDETINVIPVSDGAGNYDDSQIADDGTTVKIGSGASFDANTLITIAKNVINMMKLDQIKSDGDSFLLTLNADATNTGKNIGLKITAGNSSSENIAMAIDSGKAIIGAMTGDDSALLEISSTTAGVLIPRMNTTEMNAITSPANGLMVYNQTLNDLMVNIGDGGAPDWIGLKAVGISGSGTTNKISKFNSSTTIGDSQISDDGTSIAIGTSHDSNILMNVFTELTTAIKSIVSKTTGFVVGMISNVIGGANWNVGFFGSSTNGDQNCGVVGATDETSITNVSPFEPAGNVGVRGYTKTTSSSIKAIGTVGQSIGVGAKMNVGVLGTATGGTKNRGIVGLKGGAFFENDNENFEFNDEPSAVLFAQSTERGFMVPKMTTTQKNAIVDPANGLIVFDIDLNDLQVNIGDSITPDWTSLGSTGITGTMTLNSIPRATGVTTLADGSINDDGSNVAIGTTPNPDIQFHVATTELYGIYVSQMSTAGTNALCGTFISNGSNSADNIGLFVQTTNPGAGNAYVARFQDGNDNTGKFLKIIDSIGNTVFAHAIESGGANTSGTILKFNSNGDVVDSLISENLDLVTVNGNVVADLITTNTQFTAPTLHGNTTTSNNFQFNCDSGMTQTLDLQGQTADGTLSMVNMADGNTYSLMVIQGSGTHNLTLPSGWWLNDTPPFDFTTLADNERALITMTYINSEWMFAVKKLTYQA